MSGDEYGYKQEGNETVVRLNQRNQANTLAPKGTGERSACLSVTDIHPKVTRQTLPPYVHRQTGIRNEVTPHVLSGRGRTTGAGTHRKACGVGLSQKPMPLGNEEDKLTDSRLIGRSSCRVECNVMSGLWATYEWGQLPWRKLEVAVFKLQRRIYRASQAGDVRRVHRLQRLLLKSRAAKLLAVRRVTQDNRGKHTAGVDGIKSLTPKQRLVVAKNLDVLPIGRPARRIWIPKPGRAERRPLSIPTLYDRARQALVKQALEPEWEAKFEPNSYGFRPGRSAHDAIGAIDTAINKQPK